MVKVELAVGYQNPANFFFVKVFLASHKFQTTSADLLNAFSSCKKWCKISKVKF